MKHKFIEKYAVAVFILIIATAVHANSGLIKDMVHFDQAYIPVLTFTSAENVKAARVSFRLFEKVWGEFKNKYYMTSGKDPLWKSDFDKIDDYIQAVKVKIMRGTRLDNAHKDLEHVRVIMMHLRERNGIDYYIDHLTRFHEPMEKIVLAVNGKSVDTLTDNTISLIEKTLPEARKRWHAVSRRKFDASLYEFNKTKADMLRILVKKEGVTLARLQKAVDSKDKARIIQAGIAIKPNFAKLFKAFGHFPKRR